VVGEKIAVEFRPFNQVALLVIMRNERDLLVHPHLNRLVIHICFSPAVGRRVIPKNPIRADPSRSLDGVRCLPFIDRPAFESEITPKPAGQVSSRGRPEKPSSPDTALE
jgi:hypothetical protein